MKIVDFLRVYLVWFILLIGIFVMGVSYDPLHSVDLVSSLGKWDGEHYLLIAESGYVGLNEYAFFPLYPLLVKLVEQVVGNLILSGFLINVLSSFLAIFFLYKLVKLEFKKEVADRAVFFFLIFPTVFFLLMIYSEALFFLFTILTFYFSRLPLFDKKNSLKRSLILAAVFSGLATATRPLGIAVSIAFIVQLSELRNYLRTPRVLATSWWRNYFIALVGFISLMGLFIYCLYQFLQISDPLMFISAQGNWQRSLGWPWESFFWRVLSLAVNGISWNAYSVVFEILFGVLGVGLVLRGFRFLPKQYNVYALISILIPLFTTSLMSFPRFLLPVFPIFITLALVKNRYFLSVYSFLSLFLLVVFIILFSNGFWVS